jgi:hypothetical protein
VSGADTRRGFSVPSAAAVRSAIDRAGVRARYSARGVVSPYPSLYLPMVRHKHAGQVVDVHTDVVIEGFPRSGNTFAVVAFRLAQERSIHVAHHLHAAAQVVEGVRLRKPTIVLIRDPVDAVISHLIREPRLTPRQGLHNWVRFYRFVAHLPHRFVLATFEEVTTDLGPVIDRLNDRFGTSFARFAHTPENVERCFEWIEDRNRSQNSGLESTIARPSSARDAIKASLRPKVQSPRLRPLVARACELHESLVADAIGRSGQTGRLSA